MSGRSNVIFWLESRGLPATDEVVDRILAAAKASERTLTHEQVESSDRRPGADKACHSSTADWSLGGDAASDRGHAFACISANLRDAVDGRYQSC
mgnify:CR=1 FL=1